MIYKMKHETNATSDGMKRPVINSNVLRTATIKCLLQTHLWDLHRDNKGGVTLCIEKNHSIMQIASKALYTNCP